MSTSPGELDRFLAELRGRRQRLLRLVDAEETERAALVTQVRELGARVEAVEKLRQLVEEAVGEAVRRILGHPLEPDEGGGCPVEFPDLPGCMSDGETRELAARNVGDAIEAWIEEARALGRTIPAPSRISDAAA